MLSTVRSTTAAFTVNLLICLSATTAGPPSRAWARGVGHRRGTCGTQCGVSAGMRGFVELLGQVAVD